MSPSEEATRELRVTVEDAICVLGQLVPRVPKAQRARTQETWQRLMDVLPTLDTLIYEARLTRVAEET